MSSHSTPSSVVRSTRAGHLRWSLNDWVARQTEPFRVRMLAWLWALARVRVHVRSRPPTHSGPVPLPFCSRSSRPAAVSLLARDMWHRTGRALDETVGPDPTAGERPPACKIL